MGVLNEKRCKNILSFLFLAVQVDLTSIHLFCDGIKMSTL